MDLHLLLLAMHLLGFALGLGGATVSDALFFKSIKQKMLSTERLETFRTVSHLIWIGLILLIASGAGLFTLIYIENGSLPLLHSPRWQTKLLLVAIVLSNGIVFAEKVFPALRAMSGQTLTLERIAPHLRLLSITGTISIVSWYSIFIISVLPRTFRPPLYYFLGTYVLLLIVASLTARTILKKKLL